MLEWVFAGLLTVSSTQILLHRRTKQPSIEAFLLLRFPVACKGYTYRDYWLDESI